MAGETEFRANAEWEIDPTDLEFTDKLGEGASAKVFKGKYKNSVVAIKILKTEEEAGAKVDLKRLVRDFQQECEIMSKVKAPHLLHFYGSLVQPKVCIVVEYCSKGSLYHVMTDPEYELFELGWNRLFRWVREMVLGIQALHSCNPPIYHRDLKSLNLLLDNEWKIKVCDFGLARLSEGDTATLSKVRGTYAYCAPELYYSTLYSKSSDVYSMAVILWELVGRCISGKYQRPFGEYGHIKLGYTIIVKAAKDNLRPTMPSTIPEGLKKLIEEMWSPEPAKRPSCEAILERLDEIEKVYKENVQSWEELRVKNKELQRNLSYRRALSKDDASDLEGFETNKVHISK